MNTIVSKACNKCEQLLNLSTKTEFTDGRSSTASTGTCWKGWPDLSRDVQIYFKWSAIGMMAIGMVTRSAELTTFAMEHNAATRDGPVRVPGELIVYTVSQACPFKAPRSPPTLRHKDISQQNQDWSEHN